MEKLKKYTSVFLISIITVMSLLMTVSGAETEADLFNNDTTQDIAVFIQYEHNDISFKLISPSGSEITKDTDTENITVFSGSSSTIIFIGNAEAGQWKIKYDKGSNESITIHAGIQDSSFWITSFNKGDIADGKIPVTFSVTGSKAETYSYSVMITTDTQSLTGKTLATGTGTIGETIAEDISLDSVSTYSEYYLLLYVSYSQNGSEVFDYSYSSSFDYTNPETPDSIDDADITISHDTRSVTADWGNYIGYDTDSVFVEYYIDNDQISSQEYPVSEGTTGFFTYEEDSKTLSLKISIKNNKGISSGFKSFDIPLEDSNSISLIIPESGKTGSEIWSFQYKNANDTEVTFNINGDTQTYTLDGDGSKSLTLPETRNTIEISYIDSNGYTHIYNRMANISNTAPTLELIKELDGVTTSNDTIIIAGTTSGSSLTVNDEDVNIDNGVFSYVYELKDGKNSIVLTASSGDSSTSLTATVTKKTANILSTDSSNYNPFIPLGIGLLLSVAGITITLLMTRRKKKKSNAVNINHTANTTPAESKRQKKGKKAGLLLPAADIICWILSVLMWILFIVRKIFENSTSYIELAYESLKKADTYLIVTVCILIGAIVITLIAIILTIILIIIKGRKKRQSSQNMYYNVPPYTDYNNYNNYNSQNNNGNNSTQI